MEISTALKRHFLLVMEDEDDDILLYKHAFKTMRMGDEVFFARDGEEGIHYLSGAGPYGNRENNPLPTTILLDLKMPRKNGFEILIWRQTNPIAKVIPTVVLSTSSRKEDIFTAYQLGANAYFTKPFDLRKLISLLTMIETFWEHAQLPSLTATGGIPK